MNQVINKSRKVSKRENPLISILINIVIPAVILVYLAKESYLGPKVGFIVAFSFPLGYGILDFFKHRKFNLISVLGVINVLLSGGIGLLKIDNHWFAVKEAAIPGIIGLMALGSLKTRFPLIRTLLYNKMIINTGRVDAELQTRQNVEKFNSLLYKSTLFISGSFFLSSILNYVLAKAIVVSQPGTAAYNQELGKMTLLSYPVIVVPSMIIMGFTIWFLLRGIKDLTDLKLENILVSGSKTVEL